MRLVEIALTNYRAYGTTTRIALDPLTVIIGRNDAGKSTILEALDVFFNNAAIDSGDCCVRTGETEVRIGCVFEDLPSEIVLDEIAPTTLESEHLLRADGRLEVVKTYSCAGAKGKLVSVSAIALHPSAAGVDDLLGLKVGELRTRATSRSVDLNGVNQTVKAALRKAIWAQANDLALVAREVNLLKESASDAWDQIQLHVPAYALFKSDRPSTDQDAEAQDPLKAAIKEAIQRRASELTTIVDEIQLELAAVASRTVDKIRELSPTLASQLNPEIKQKPWDSLFSVSLTAEDAIPINKRGSGTRRLVLLSFFRAKAEATADTSSSGLIYAIEEPETSQHPNNQVLLLEAFQDIVDHGNAQVIMTTHTPTLARRVDRQALRFVAPTANGPFIHLGSEDATLEAIKRTLGVLADHDVRAFLGVEGKHDITFLKRLSAILGATEADIPNLETAEAQGKLMFVPLAGSNMDLWITRLANLNRPEFYLTDRDKRPPEPPKYASHVADWTARGCTAWVTSKRELENYVHPTILQTMAAGYTGTGNDSFEDVPLLFAQATHASGGGQPWAALDERAKSRKVSAAKRTINDTCASQMTPELLSQLDPNDDVRSWLRAIGGVIA